MPYNIIKVNNKYELRLLKDNKLLGTHKTKKEANKQIQAIELSKGRKDADLYIKANEIADEKYGTKHSARKQQQISRIYRELGGEYTEDLKPNQQSLKKWTAEDWGSDIPFGRYLPKKIREKLTPEEYIQTSEKKIKDTLKGIQYSQQPKNIIEKIYKGKGQTTDPFKKVGKYTYYLSDKPNKKLMTIINGKKIYFGATGYEHFRDKTGLLNPELSHFDKARRNRYISRHGKIEDKDGNLVILNPESPAYHALNILW